MEGLDCGTWKLTISVVHSGIRLYCRPEKIAGMSSAGVKKNKLSDCLFVGRLYMRGFKHRMNAPIVPAPALLVLLLLRITCEIDYQIRPRTTSSQPLPSYGPKMNDYPGICFSDWPIIIDEAYLQTLKGCNYWYFDQGVVIINVAAWTEPQP